jgi:hypothetical protein
VDLEKNDFTCAIGWPSMVTVAAQPLKSAATTVLGSGTGTGPAGGPGGHRQTSGKATACPTQFLKIAARPLMKDRVPADGVNPQPRR